MHVHCSYHIILLGDLLSTMQHVSSKIESTYSVITNDNTRTVHVRTYNLNLKVRDYRTCMHTKRTYVQLSFHAVPPPPREAPPPGGWPRRQFRQVGKQSTQFCHARPHRALYLANIQCICSGCVHTAHSWLSHRQYGPETQNG